MSADVLGYAVSGVLAAVVMIYLLAALLFTEKF